MESLTPKRMEILKKARSDRTRVHKRVGIADGKILHESSTENKVKLYCEYH